MSCVVKTLEGVRRLDFESIPEDSFWNTGEQTELKMHRIHAYPAKFPAFITTKTLEYANKRLIKVSKIADVFCGCGTVAFESKRNNIDFWGCDINPVATMIAKTKSRKYCSDKLYYYYNAILRTYYSVPKDDLLYENAHERLKYWYSKLQFDELYRLKTAIDTAIPTRSVYKNFFYCAFSNILKASSKWLTKSIKPQIDPNKIPSNVMKAFEAQYKFMVKANEENDAVGTASSKINTANFLSASLKRPKVDLIVTSPPYVTSYEYADLHQLSSLWLQYANDYRELRDGSIGSLFHVYNFDREMKQLNQSASSVVGKLIEKDKRTARSVAKYYLDMQRASSLCYEMLNEQGMALFVIGDTEYQGVKIGNARHLAESLLGSGFASVCITKRKITRKILTPYRDLFGKFSTNHSDRRVYGEEFILIGRK